MDDVPDEPDLMSETEFEYETGDSSSDSDEYGEDDEDVMVLDQPGNTAIPMLFTLGSAQVTLAVAPEAAHERIEGELAEDDAAGAIAELPPLTRAVSDGAMAEDATAGPDPALLGPAAPATENHAETVEALVDNLDSQISVASPTQPDTAPPSAPQSTSTMQHPPSTQDNPDSDSDSEPDPEPNDPNPKPPRIRVQRRKPSASNADTRLAGRSFQAGDYSTADALYTKALTADPSQPLLYTNRAMARLKLALYDGVVQDCEESLRLLPVNMKAHYYRAQALLELKKPAQALEAGRQAYELAAGSGDPSWERSMGAIVGVVQRCKKAVWERREAARLREREPLKMELLEMMERERDAEIAKTEIEEEKMEIRQMWEEKMSHLKSVWEKAEGPEAKQREVPEWMVDDITFAIMHDPVITKTGNSYERASIMEHLRRQHTDPLTRTPLSPDELRPNIALREAIEEFLVENGWAVDY